MAPFRARSLPALRRCLRDRHPGVVESAVYAIDHLEVRFRSRLLSGLVRHRDRRVRQAVAHAVGGETDRLAIRLLLDLARDRDGETRNWALFGLGRRWTSPTPSTDTAEIRDALLAGVRDRHREARGEALRALALRHDERVLEPLSRELRVRPVSYLAVEAAEALGHPTLRAPLFRLKPREAWTRPTAAGRDRGVRASTPSGLVPRPRVRPRGRGLWRAVNRWSIVGAMRNRCVS